MSMFPTPGRVGGRPLSALTAAPGHQDAIRRLAYDVFARSRRTDRAGGSPRRETPTEAPQMASKTRKTRNDPPASPAAKAPAKARSRKQDDDGPPPVPGADGSPNAARQRQPTIEQIRQRAFEIYQARKGGPGDPDADWIQAERELWTELDPS